MFFKRAPRERLDRVIKLYLAYKFFGALYFTYPIFYEFASRTITPVQVGMFFSVIAMCGLIADIPTAIVADKRSRKFSALVGVGLLAVAPVAVLVGTSFPMYIVAALFYGLGGAFMSGTLESLVYDHKNVTKAMYRRVNAFEITYGQAGILVSAACGGVLFSISHGAPFVTQAATGIICVVLIALMQEQYKESHVRSVVSSRKHFSQSLKHLLATPYLRVIVLMGVVFSVMLGMCIQFVNEAAMIEHGMQGAVRGFLVSGAGVATLIILNFFLLRWLKSDAARILYLGCGAAVAYVCMSLGSLPLFLLGYLMWCCLNVTSSFIRVMIQDHIPGSHRSTIMSSFKTLAVLVGLGASTGTGILVQWAHTPRAAYALFASIAFVILLPCALWLTAHLKKLESEVSL